MITHEELKKGIRMCPHCKKKMTKRQYSAHRSVCNRFNQK